MGCQHEISSTMLPPAYILDNTVFNKYTGHRPPLRMRELGIVPTRAQWGLGTLHTLLNYFAGCAAFFAMFVNFKCNIAHEVRKTQARGAGRGLNPRSPQRSYLRQTARPPRHFCQYTIDCQYKIRCMCLHQTKM